MAEKGPVIKIDGDPSPLVAKVKAAFSQMSGALRGTFSPNKMGLAELSQTIKQVETQIASMQRSDGRAMAGKATEVKALKAQLASLRDEYNALGGADAHLAQMFASSSSKKVSGMKDQQREIDAIIQKLGGEDAAWEAVSDTASAMQLKVENLKSTFKNGIIGGDLSKRGKADIAAITQEWAEVSANIQNAIDGTEELTDLSRAYLGVMSQAPFGTTLGRHQGVTPPGSTSGRQQTRLQQMQDDPTRYYAGQFVFQSARVAQDSPFGLLGIANNLDQWLHAFKMMKAAAAETGVSMKQSIVSQMKGAYGAMLGLNIATALMIGWPKIVAGFGWLKEQFGGLRDMSKEISDNMVKSIGGMASFSTGLKSAEEEFESARAILKAIDDKRNEIRQLSKVSSEVGMSEDRLSDVPVRGALSKDDVAEIKRLDERYRAQEEILKKASENLSQERAKIEFQSLAEVQAIRDRARREQEQALLDHLEEEIKIRKAAGEDAEGLIRQQFEAETRLRSQLLREQAVEMAQNFSRNPGNELLRERAYALLGLAMLLEDTVDERFQESRDKTKKEIESMMSRIEDFRFQTAAILRGSRDQTFAARRQEVTAEAAQNTRLAERELEEFKGTAEERALFAEAVEERITAIAREAAFKRVEIARDEREAIAAQASELASIRQSISSKELEAVVGRQAERDRMQLAHENTISQIRERIDAQGRLTGDAATGASERIAAMEAEIDAETDAHNRRVALWDREIELQEARAREAVAAKSIQIGASLELLRFEQDAFNKRTGQRFLGMRLNPNGIAETQETALARQQLQERLEREELQRQFDNARRERERQAEQTGVPLDDQIEQDLAQQHQDELTRILEQGLLDRQQLEVRFSEEMFTARLEASETALDAFGSVFRSATDMWENSRRSQLASEGKSQQEINRIIREEGSKRFRWYKLAATSEAIIATYLSARKTAAATAHLGPVAQGIAVAAELAQGFAHVAQIKAQTIGGSATGGGGSAGSGNLLGAVATTSGGTSSSNGSQVAGKASSSQAAAIAAGVSVAGKAGAQDPVDVAGVVDQIVTANDSRPVVVVLESETQGRIVQHGAAVNQRRHR